jgi:hypothetical protein
MAIARPTSTTIDAEAREDELAGRCPVEQDRWNFPRQRLLIVVACGKRRDESQGYFTSVIRFHHKSSQLKLSCVVRESVLSGQRLPAVGLGRSGLPHL